MMVAAGLQARTTCAVTIGLIFLAMTPWFARAADPVRLLFVARVDNVYDPGEALQDGIHVGDVLRGTITYDGSARNTESRADVGRYEHHRPPYGMLVEAGPFVFQTDPHQVDFTIVMSNDRGSPPRDSYVMTSEANLPLQNGSLVSRMTWELVDDSHTALDGIKLPANAPDLTKWRSDFGLTLNGQGTVEFIVRAHVTEAALCTRGMRCPSPE